MKRDPILCLNVQVKPISGKVSWTVHESREKADREARSSVAARKAGHHVRRIYRVNVYPKFVALCGNMGRELEP